MKKWDFEEKIKCIWIFDASVSGVTDDIYASGGIPDFSEGWTKIITIVKIQNYYYPIFFSLSSLSALFLLQVRIWLCSCQRKVFIKLMIWYKWFDNLP